MSRPPSHYRDEIVRAVLGDDAVGAMAAKPDRLGQLAIALAQAEAAKDLLCKNGYGEPSTPIDAMVLLVPEAPKGK